MYQHQFLSLLSRLESAYSLNWGVHEIWGQGEGRPFMISRPIYQDSDLWIFSIWNGLIGK